MYVFFNKFFRQIFSTNFFDKLFRRIFSTNFFSTNFFDEFFRHKDEFFRWIFSTNFNFFDEFFIFYPLQALGSEYLRSCFFLNTTFHAWIFFSFMPLGTFFHHKRKFITLWIKVSLISLFLGINKSIVLNMVIWIVVFSRKGYKTR